MTVEGEAAGDDVPSEINVLGRGHEPVVYYARKDGLIKIGFTTHLDARLANLGAEAVLAVEPGDRPTEAARHEQFAGSREHGEWFTPTPALLDLVEELGRRYPLPEHVNRPRVRRPRLPDPSARVLCFLPGGALSAIPRIHGVDCYHVHR